MKKSNLSESNHGLWILISKLSHSILLARQKELNPYHIPVRQYQVLRTIYDLGSKATVCEVAKRIEREPHTISRQTVMLVKDGLLERTRNIPKSKLLKLELTKKGLNMIKAAKRSKSVDARFSLLSWEERQQLESILKKLLIE